MEKKEKLFCLEVWGDYACFTRPEMKVERVSYDVITPSAARAIFEAVFWKPAIKWHIREIDVLAPIRMISIKRNEVGSTAGTGKVPEIFIEDNRLLRSGLFLRDVRYRLHAWMEYIPLAERTSKHTAIPERFWDKDETADNLESIRAFKSEEDEKPGKYFAMFERRARKGQCFNQPYLGCREFSAQFELIENKDVYKEKFHPIVDTRDLGYMLYDMDYTEPDNIKPAFFRAKLNNGRVIVPEWNSNEVLQ